MTAQGVEAVGSRALGMGGAFVAVASDSSATWWNPAGLAAGPFLDMALARTLTETTGSLPVRRDRASWFALGTPPFGLSYYRLRYTDIRPFDPTGATSANREDRRAEVPVRSLQAGQLGITLVQTIFPGVHAGTTLKYLRGTVRTGRSDALRPAGDLLDDGEGLEGGEGSSTFDLDAGLLASAGPVSLGLVVRNVREPEFSAGEVTMTLPRQVRAGAAFDTARVAGPPLTFAIDADVVAYDTVSGERRNVALGAEGWLLARRIGLRGGARFNTVGARERSATAGGSYAVRSGLYLDAHVVRGGSADERGWGVAARVSF